ncbi:hypothetical protein FQN54_000181 [Arachnomyces sp. PD_36]|nr:hypothetical protein FQN54_000181 [Arachnomyces sp. PD_36]
MIPATILHNQRQVTTIPPLLNTNFSRPNFTTSPDSARSNSQRMDISAIAEIPRRDSNQETTSPSRPNNVSSPTSTKSNNSPTDEEYPPQVQNGRTYHGYRRGLYLFPCDEQEQDRLDIFHKLFDVARFERLHYAPLYRAPTQTNGQGGVIPPPSDHGPRVLDLGCGTGIWAMDMAKLYKDAYVVGIDLAAIQPRNHPPNCDFYAPCDFESSWTLGEDSWDYIHLRMGCGSISNWPTLYRKVLAHLRPGTGWFEWVEVDFEPRCDGQLPAAMTDWYKDLKEATHGLRKPIAFPKNTQQMLEEAGFVQIDHQFVGLPLNTWPEDEHEKNVGRWYNLALSESLETLSLAPFYRGRGMDLQEIRRRAAEVKSLAFNKQIQSYHLLRIITARRPYPVSLVRKGSVDRFTSTSEPTPTIHEDPFILWALTELRNACGSATPFHLSTNDL